MNTVNSSNTKDIFEPTNEVAQYSKIEEIFNEYNAVKKDIVAIEEFLSERNHALDYYFDNNAGKRGYVSKNELFDLQGTIKCLDSQFWKKVIDLTNIIKSMPAKMQQEWRDNLIENKTPPFERETVESTIKDLLYNQEKFFSLKVDGLFRSLSNEHLTNQPQGFGKRMILNNVIGSYGWLNSDKANYIHDLRFVIGTFMGREIPNTNITSSNISSLIDNGDYGQWHAFDGGAFKLKIFKKGTCHLEVNPSMAWKLNKVLASLNPAAIPSEFRQAPKKKVKSHVLREDLISFKVLDNLSRLSVRKSRNDTHYSITENICEKSESGLILSYIGGIKTMHGWDFSYYVKPVIHEICRTGSLPEKQSHQFYATPVSLAERVFNLADIQDDDLILEPSAGLGDLLIPYDPKQVTCIEISHLHCKVLAQKGYKAINRDFLTYEFNDENYPKILLDTDKFDKIVMNPPFSDGRALDHLKKAATHLASDGTLIAIMPGSFINKDLIEGFDHGWSEIIENEFKVSGTGIRVAILTLTHKLY